ncbi:serine/threonine-protein kinase [Iningainema tapete]|uniref:non-specific serine/threonine protein kinase n=1 Tax=Iningainema tapete BLCC-T55 TaxID=2748662 RepID=A0A8J7C8Y7_9CYAN|nr:serine/threonine-protein kinase [Iningainema tapete]MBD2775306.1 tetratricopeptide repeat protein [Iningainema tapete BLCC-T55]
MLGKILNNRYHIIDKLGGGWFGETYLAIDQWLDGDNLCVVKQLKPNIINKSTLRLFEQEAQVLFKLGSHDQIPKLLAHFQQDEEFYLVQEFIDGHNLTQEIKPGECWGETKVIELLQEILEVLDFVHQNNVIHRDIKPKNMMRRHDGKIVLIDFGGVKQLTAENSSTVSTYIVGTPGYMPQEQINNQAQLCSDIYAVGMLAISALTGWNPNELPTDPKTLQLLWRDKAQVSDRLAEILDHMVQFHFAQRYQSASEVLDAVNSLSLTSLDWYNRGQELYKLQSYEEAVIAFDQAIQIQPDYYQAWYNRGNALRGLKKNSQAIASYDQAIQIKRDLPEAWYSRGMVLYTWGRYDEAIESYDQAIQIKQDHPDTWYYRGMALYRIGRYILAIASFDQALSIEPDHQLAIANRKLAHKELRLRQSKLLKWLRLLLFVVLFSLVFLGFAALLYLIYKLSGY